MFHNRTNARKLYEKYKSHLYNLLLSKEIGGNSALYNIYKILILSGYSLEQFDLPSLIENADSLYYENGNDSISKENCNNYNIDS